MTIQIDGSFSVLRENLKLALNALIKVVDARPQLPVLGNVLIEAEGSKVELSATNLQVSVITRIGAKINSPCALSLPAKMLNDIVSHLADDRVEIAFKAANMSAKIKCGSTVTNLNGIDPINYPPFDEAFGKAKVLHEFDIDGKSFLTLMRPMHAAATNANRIALNCMLFHFKHEQIYTACADGNRMSVTRVDCLHGLDPNIGLTLLLPIHSVAALARLIEEDDDIHVAIDDQNRVRFTLPQTDFIMATVNERFPDYELFIPRNTKTESTCYRDDLANVIDRTQIFARDADNTIIVKVTVPTAVNTPGELTVKSKSAERGDVESVIDCAAKGVDLTMYISSLLVRDALSAIKTERVLIKTIDDQNPMIVTPDDPNDYFVCVLMPRSAK
jgi:DNA polymerase-3 subunit beta